MLAGTVHERPTGVDAETDSVIVPVKPFRGVAKIVEFPVEPARTCPGDTVLVEILKSTTVNVIARVECD